MAALVYPAQGIPQEVPRQPQIEIHTDGAITNIQTGGDGWNGVIRKVQELRKIPRDRDSEVISALSSNLDNLPPPYAYEIVRRTCLTDPEKAANLFSLTGLRIRYDALKCVDETAKPGVQATLYSLQMPECKEMLSNSELSLGTYRRLRDAKELFSSKASPWWICSHGMKAVMAGLEKKTIAVSDWLKPETEWPVIQKEVRDMIEYTIEKHSKK